MPKSNDVRQSFLCSKFLLKPQLKMDFNHEEAYENSSNDMLADEYSPVVDQGAFQFSFGSLRPGQNDKDGNPIITIIDRSGIHKIGIRWCCYT